MMAEEVFSSSTPMQLNTDPDNNNSDSFCGTHIEYERIYHGIYLTSIEKLCSPENLKMYGFTHIIYIDKHIIESNSLNTHVTMRQMSSYKLPSSNDGIIPHTPKVKTSHTYLDSNFSGANKSISALSNNSSPPFSDDRPIEEELPKAQPTLFRHVYSRNEFHILDLNFGETSYLATVLPNCYKAVKFIENALKQNGAVLVIDCIGSNQKCITIVTGFLMYKYNKNFSKAYQLIKRLHPTVELDQFFTMQLYEYEPILQVQRSQLAGNSCSRELRSALLKRKKTYDDNYFYQDNTITPIRAMDYQDSNMSIVDQNDILMDE